MSIVQQLRNQQELIKNLYPRSATQMITNIHIVNMQFDLFEIESWNNHEIEFHHSSVNDVLFPSEWLIRKMNGLSEYIKNENDRYIYIMEELLFCEVDDIQMFKRVLLLDKYNCNDNIKERSIDTSKVINMNGYKGQSATNPAYLQGECYKSVLLEMKETSEGTSVFPGTLLFNKKPTTKTDVAIEFLEECNKRITDIQIHNGHYLFPEQSINAQVAFVIIHWVENNNATIKITDYTWDKEYCYTIHDISELRALPPYERREQMIKDVLKDAANSSLENFKNIYRGGSYYLKATIMRGHMNATNHMMRKSEYFTFASNENLIPTTKAPIVVGNGYYFSIKENGKGNKVCIWFNGTLKEMTNLSSALKLDDWRFALSISKINKQIARKELMSVPWTEDDFSKQHYAGELFKKYKWSQKDIDYIKIVIQPHIEYLK
jgi:hypothetical protein